MEHLDPTPLSSLGLCLLGGLQPRVLVVTTPNKEYNAVLHQLGNALLPNKLRNTDHRFEWRVLLHISPKFWGTLFFVNVKCLYLEGQHATLFTLLNGPDPVATPHQTLS